MAKASVNSDNQAAAAEMAHFAVFAINAHFTLGLWSLETDKLPEGHEAFMRPANDQDIAMARHIIKTLEA